MKDYPDGPLIRKMERDETLSDMIEERKEELLSDKDIGGYYPWRAPNIVEALGEMPLSQLNAIGALLDRATTVDDASAGLLIRRYVLKYWETLADEKAEREVKDRLRKEHECYQSSKAEWKNG